MEDYKAKMFWLGRSISLLVGYYPCWGRRGVWDVSSNGWRPGDGHLHLELYAWRFAFEFRWARMPFRRGD